MWIATSSFPRVVELVTRQGRGVCGALQEMYEYSWVMSFSRIFLTRHEPRRYTMDFTESNWLSILKAYAGFPLRRWLCVYFATLSGCEPVNNIPCTITHHNPGYVAEMLVTSSIDSHVNPIAERNRTDPTPTPLGAYNTPFEGRWTASCFGVSLFLFFRPTFVNDQ